MDKKEQILMARIEDALMNNWAPQFFDFLDAAAQARLLPVLNRSGEPFCFFGGMPEAERKMLCIYPDYLEENQLEWPMMAARFEKNFPLDHRHVLGTLMGLGMTRECVGDIHVGDTSVQIIFTDRMENFMRVHLDRIRGRKINPVFSRDIEAIQLSFKTLHLVAASRRLDGVVSKIFGLSREAGQQAVRQGRVRVNALEMLKPDYAVCEGDILAVRGRGKAIVRKWDGTTRKGHLRLIADQYI